jgi:hypothetical protein
MGVFKKRNRCSITKTIGFITPERLFITFRPVMNACWDNLSKLALVSRFAFSDSHLRFDNSEGRFRL